MGKNLQQWVKYTASLLRQKQTGQEVALVYKKQHKRKK